MKQIRDDIKQARDQIRLFIANREQQLDDLDILLEKTYDPNTNEAQLDVELKIFIKSIRLYPKYISKEKVEKPKEKVTKIPSYQRAEDVLSYVRTRKAVPPKVVRLIVD